MPGLAPQLECIKEHKTDTQEALQQAQQKLIKETKYTPFKENDRVWLEGTHLKLPYNTMKLTPRQYGPFRVAAKVSDIAYRLELPQGWKIHNIFHASLFTPYNETQKHGPNFLEPLPDLIDGEPEWEVEQIIGHQTYRRKKQYLVRWKGYTPAHDSWIDESDLHTPDLLSDYRATLATRIVTNLAQSSATSPAQSSAQSACPEPCFTNRIRTLEVLPETPDHSPFPPLIHDRPHHRRNPRRNPDTPANDLTPPHTPAPRT